MNPNGFLSIAHLIQHILHILQWFQMAVEKNQNQSNYFTLTNQNSNLPTEILPSSARKMLLGFKSLFEKKMNNTMCEFMLQ